MTETLLAFGRTWALSLYETSVQVAVLVLLVSVASLFLRRSSPSVRYGLWCIVLLRLCIPVEFSVPPSVSPSVPSSFARSQERPAPGMRFASSERGRDTRELRERGARSRSSRWEAVARTRRNLTVMGVAWGATFLALAGLVGFRAVALHRRIRSLPPADSPDFAALLRECCSEMGIRRAIQVRCAPDQECGAPAVTAIFSPVIILPETMVHSWEKQDLKPILMHELAHVRRFDVVINWLQILLQCVYFFHPLVWFANWKIRALREEACDDLSVARLGGRRTRYSRSLLRAVELAGAGRPVLCGAVGLGERRSDLGKRLRRLLTDGYHPSSESCVASACKVAVLGGICLFLSGMVPVKPPISPRLLKMAVAGPECRSKWDGRKGHGGHHSEFSRKKPTEACLATRGRKRVVCQ